MLNGVGEKEDTEAMEEEKLSAVNMDVNGGGGGNNRLAAAAAEDTRLCGSQNGEAEEDEAAAAAERTGCKRRNSSEPANMEGVRGGSTPTEEPPRKRFQIPKKSREKKGGRHLLPCVASLPYVNGVMLHAYEVTHHRGALPGLM